MPENCPARQNTLSGGLAVGGTYDSNVYKTDNYRKGEWKNRLAPQLTITSLGETDSLALTYSPEYAYNFRREDDEMTHALSLLADKGLSSKWKVKLNGSYANYDTLRFETDRHLSTAQNFLRADAPTQADIVRILFPELAWDPAVYMGYVVSQFQARYGAALPSDRTYIDTLLFEGSGGRQKYWTSAMNFSSEYEFADKSLFTLGYLFSTQESKSGTLSDHTQQGPSVKLSYQFTRQWRAEIGYDLLYDSYDITEDSRTNRPHLQVEFEISPQDLLSWNYTYQQINFDGIQGDTTDQSTDLGWKHSLDQQTSLTASLGTAYLSRDLAADEREYRASLGVSRNYDRGSIAFTGNVLTAVDDQSGDWEKSRRSWELGSNMTYKLRQDLSSTGLVSYGQWRSWTLGIDDKYNRLQLAAGLNYQLGRWVAISLNYNYSMFDTVSNFLEDYTEHLVSIQLSAAKELWQW